MLFDASQRSSYSQSPMGKSLVRSSIASILGLTAASLVHAQESSGDAETAKPLDTVVVLGTSREDTTALTSTAPVDVISPEQLQRTGAVTINQALSKLHPSFNFPQGQNAVKGQGVRAASLRGVGPGVHARARERQAA